MPESTPQNAAFTPLLSHVNYGTLFYNNKNDGDTKSCSLSKDPHADREKEFQVVD
ncbi:hypothetical protein GCM10009122_05120 [Fulvivirga kasyanovii]